LKEKGTQIKAVINLDMIGYNTDQNRIFEIHAGFPDPVVRDLCVPLAELVKRWSDNLGKVGPAQIYKGTRQGNENDYDRDLFDGAIKRSDHYSFQIHGYPSIHISEDFFANLPIEPDKDNNPEYHKFTDTKIDSSYVSNIVNALGFAIKELASK
jgi:Zn-dependent M28 family amino/carboxypeptidase